MKRWCITFLCSLRWVSVKYRQHTSHNSNSSCIFKAIPKNWSFVWFWKARDRASEFAISREYKWFHKWYLYLHPPNRSREMECLFYQLSINERRSITNKCRLHPALLLFCLSNNLPTRIWGLEKLLPKSGSQYPTRSNTLRSRRATLKMQTQTPRVTIFDHSNSGFISEISSTSCPMRSKRCTGFAGPVSCCRRSVRPEVEFRQHSGFDRIPPPSYHPGNDFQGRCLMLSNSETVSRRKIPRGLALCIWLLSSNSIDKEINNIENESDKPVQKWTDETRC